MKAFLIVFFIASQVSMLNAQAIKEQVNFLQYAPVIPQPEPEPEPETQPEPESESESDSKS